MKTQILKVKGDWCEVVDDCRSTVGKESLGKEPSETFKRKVLIAEHSPIRDISVKWKWNNIKSWIATHWVRHKWECFVKTQRTDRTGVNRDELPQSAEVTFTGEANCQHLIDTMRKRLCYQASPETRAYAEDLKTAITLHEKEIGDVLVPNCVYRGGCPEMTPCGYYERLITKYPAINSTDIQERYNAYNKIFAERTESANLSQKLTEMQGTQKENVTLTIFKTMNKIGKATEQSGKATPDAERSDNND